MITCLEVKGLFGTFDYSLSISEDRNPFILTGPNGYGKTTILNIISELSRRNLYYFYLLPFESITIRMDNGAEIRVRSDRSQTVSDGDETLDASDGKRSVIFQWTVNGNTVGELELTERLVSRALRRVAVDYHSYQYAFDVTSRSVYRHVCANLQRFNDGLSALLPAQAQLFMMQLDSLKVTFVGAQRVYAVPDEKQRKPQTEVIEEISEEFQGILKQEQLKFLKISQDKDSQFIDTLMTSEKTMSEQEYRDSQREVSELLTGLKSFGLVGEITLPEYVDAKSVILGAYISDMKSKLGAYKPILSKLQLFVSILNQKRLTNKTVDMDVAHGLRMRGHDGALIDLDKLSSGEKNQIIMLYDFIFRVSDKTLLLIDEPEISLHVAWQMEFLNDIEKIAREKNLQVWVATHSPQIIGDRWTECYDLEENQAKNVNTSGSDGE